MKKIIALSTLVLAGALAITSCKKKFDEPPVKSIPESARITIAQLKSKWKANVSYRFQNDSNLYCVVTSDEVSGNLYKEAYVHDQTGALHLRLVYSGGLYIGDSIRINLKGCYLKDDNNLIQLDSVNTEKSVVKLASGLNPQPEKMTISQILASTSATNSVQSKLVRIDSVEFIAGASYPAGFSTYADAIGKNDVNQFIKSCSSSFSLTVRSSGYSNFAGTALPTGNGSIIGIVSQYGTTMQLSIRKVNEVNMTGSLCATPVTTFVIGSPVTSINESFNGITAGTDFALTGWINYNQVGSVKWKGDVTSSTYKSIKATAFSSGDANNTMWVITPPVVYTNTMTLSFKTGYGFWDAGHPNAIMAYVSTDFNGLNFATANWTPITGATYANGTGGFYTGAAGLYNSGTINLNTISILNSYSGNFFVAWKYVGSATYNSNIYLDDIVIQ